jgi:hypothetical protein
MAQAIGFNQFLLDIFGEHENLVVYSTDEPGYTQAQDKLLMRFCRNFEAHSGIDDTELDAIIERSEQVFAMEGAGLQIFWLKSDSHKLSTESLKLLKSVYAAFPDAKSAGALAIYEVL